MSNNRPLGYESSKRVFQFLAPGLRYSLAKQCPALSTIHKLLPLNISCFETHPNSFEIDGIVYKIGIIQVYENGQTPKPIQIKNEQGGWQKDVDDYGVKLKYHRDVEQDSWRIENLHSKVGRQMKDRREKQTEQLAQAVEMTRLKISALKLRMTDTPPPFTHYFQLQLSKKGNILRIERFVYNKTIDEARRYFMDKMFYDRKVNISKLVLGVDYGKRFTNNVPSLMFPIEPEKMTVHHLKLKGDYEFHLNVARPFLIKNPLKSVELPYYYYTMYEDPIIRNSEIAIHSDLSSINDLAVIPSDRVHLKSCLLSERDARLLVLKWRLVGVNFGKNYSIGFDHLWDAVTMMAFFLSFPKVQKIDLKGNRRGLSYCVALQIKSTTELLVYCEVTNPDDRKFCHSPLILKLKTQPIGSGVSF